IIIQTINLPLKKIQVYDLIGKEIASYEGSNEIRINTSSLSKGVYIVKCQTESNNIVYKKFIKQ
ncbi:MAG: T9SS type A sorting domain-containing protein, partial [Bacteroidales bacterium]